MRYGLLYGLAHTETAVEGVREIANSPSTPPCYKRCVTLGGITDTTNTWARDGEDKTAATVS